MSPTNQPDPAKAEAQLQLAMARLLDGEAEPGDDEMVAAALVNNPALEAQFRGMLRLDNALRTLNELDHESFAEGVAERIAADSSTNYAPFLQAVELRIAPRWWQRATSAWATTAAACLALAGLSWFVVHQSNPEIPNPIGAAGSEEGSDHSSEAISVATITSVGQEVTLEPSLKLGHRVNAGLVSITTGTVQLTFDCGAVVQLTGPARLRIHDDFRTTLESGVASARLPEQAQGFLILTPTSIIKDLGTEFAVRVGNDGNTELHVLEGVVEASPNQSNQAAVARRKITERHAVRINSGNMDDMPYAGESLVTILPPAPVVAVPKFTRWHFDDLHNGLGTDESGVYHLTQCLTKPGKADPTDRSIPTAHGKGLSFDGEKQFISTDHPGITGNAPRTVAFWTRIPAQPTVRWDRSDLPNGIVAWGAVSDSKKWQIAWNNGVYNGTVGAIRQEFGNGYVIGSTDLRDGQWHHIAVVFHGGENVDVATNVKIYVDGRLDTVSGRKQQSIRTEPINSGGNSVTFGRYLGIWTKYPALFFEGALDEVYIIEGALSQSQVASLMATNSLEP